MYYAGITFCGQPFSCRVLTQHWQQEAADVDVPPEEESLQVQVEQ